MTVVTAGIASDSPLSLFHSLVVFVPFLMWAAMKLHIQYHRKCSFVYTVALVHHFQEFYSIQNKYCTLTGTGIHINSMYH